MRSEFLNRDHAVVKLTFFASGTENMTLWQGQSNNIQGPDGSTFKYAWKDRDEVITVAELEAYGAQGVYGQNYILGRLPGRVP